MTAADHVAHGYTLQGLDRLAEYTVRSNTRWWPAGDRRDMYDTAWHGIVEHLYRATEPPTRHDLVDAARAAIRDQVESDRAHHGWAYRGTGDRYAAYWQWHSRITPSHETAIVDRLALKQITPLLEPRQMRALNALAATGDCTQAAELLGVTTKTVWTTVGRARAEFLGWWHQGETPSRPWRCSKPAPVRDTTGRQRLTAQQVDALRARHHNGERLRPLAEEAGVSAATLSRLIRGISRPAPDQEAA